MLSSWTDDDEVPKGEYKFVYPAYFGNRIQQAEDNPATNAGVYLGRRLFYEARLSANNSLSCGSCHMQEKAFTDGQKLSRGVDGTFSDRNAMALVNLLWARKLFWDGRSASLEGQASVPMINPHEMGQSLSASAKKLQETSYYPQLFKQVYGDEQVTGKRIVMALAQFERTLISANSRYDRYLESVENVENVKNIENSKRIDKIKSIERVNNGDNVDKIIKNANLSAEEMRGMLLFNTAPDPEKGIRGANCAHCHGGPKNYLELFHNNGLDLRSKDAGIALLTGQKTDHGRFKVPTLRNIELTAPYMHDGRFNTLEEVIEHYSEHMEQPESLSAFLQHESNIKGGTSLKLRSNEKKELIAFLKTLTDSTFIADPRFSNPFLTAKTSTK
ncbi:cytochrome-c peroxidase [Pedobacter metabolipauper]|uniref:Cytochrome c peroxidase n=1 Tax=Pedobacter metabolipauper TaxID=425513 RepID=A0A4R6T1R6_9SPHI|nr:cytochrome c peroxidase [Pedobacter metabolipauper]TDQ11271.1 cytochrome c peroxidase [Pedobacter metabolipauper]